MEARERLSALSLARLQRGVDSLSARPGLADPSAAAESYARWTATYDWRDIYSHEYLYAGPLFIHQFSHIWIDFRGIQDDYMRDKRSDYFENSRRATYVQRSTRSPIPLDTSATAKTPGASPRATVPGRRPNDQGNKRRFFGYKARGAP